MNTSSTESSEVQTSKWKIFLSYATGVTGVVSSAILGALFGTLLRQVNANDTVVSWVVLPGDLFIRALKCLITPLVFCSLVTGMADMLNVGKASTVGFKTVAWYMSTTLLASIEGLVWVLIFRPWFSSKDGEDQEVMKALALKCQNGKYIESINETFACTGSDITNSTQFEVVDINNVFKLAAEPYVRLSLSDALQDQLKQMIPDNITQAFATSNLLSIIMFAIPFGIAISTLPTARDGMNRLLELFRLLNEAFMMMIRGAIVLTPIAVFFMISGSLASQDNLGRLMEDVGVLILTVVCGLVIHVVFVLPGFLAFIIKKNPYPYMRQMFEAQVFALGCSSSMATLPVTMKCVENTGEVPATLAKFVLSLGATINMDGSAIYYPAAIVFMAETAGFGDQVGGVELFLLVILSTIGAVGSAPVPSAGIVMIITIWNSVFPSIPLPDTFTYIIATDWLLDRGITAVNVTGDTVIARIIAELVDGTTIEVERKSIISYCEDPESVK